LFAPQDVDLATVLLGVHEFFQALGIDEIRQRGTADDKPLRMVKTLLHELCKRKVSATWNRCRCGFTARQVLRRPRHR
jgi:hypothetical protein